MSTAFFRNRWLKQLETEIEFLSESVGEDKTVGLRHLLKSYEKPEYNKVVDGEQSLKKDLFLLNQQLENHIAISNSRVVEAEMASHLKSQFLANKSHEIRTPMNAILGMASILTDSNLSEEQRGHIKTISSSAESLLELINDLLDFSKIEASQLSLEKIPFSVQHIFADINSLFSTKAKEKGLSLTFNVAFKEDNYFLGDPTRIRQILINLIGNALKFTERGSIQVSAELNKFKNDIIGNLLFSVKDTGIGINKESCESIFCPYVQADSTTTRKYGGTGLGLAISQRMSIQMGGEMWVNSQLAKGSIFNFTITADSTKELPAELRLKREPKKDSSIDSVAFEKLKVLVADDNPINRKVIRLLLAKLHITPDEAENGLEVLTCMRDQAYDIIFMDIQMPEMDGIEATQSIRKEFSQDQQPSIIALTAAVGARERQMTKDAGMDAFLAKPIRSKELKHTLDQLMTNKS